jgi:hypothetical protein
MNENVISLVVGDWSHDGHSQTDTVVISCNLTRPELEKAYKKGVKVTGIDLHEHCEEYEDPYISVEIYKRLSEVDPDLIGAGELRDPNSEPDEDDSFWINSEEYATLWMLIAQAGNPALKWSVTPDNSARINIGGYGLFSS